MAGAALAGAGADQLPLQPYEGHGAQHAEESARADPERWGDLGVFARIMEGLAAADPEPKAIMIDATYLKAHRTATSLRSKKEGVVD